MKPIDKKDMPKLYAVIGAAVLLLGYVLYTSFGTPAPDVSASGKKDAAAGAPAPGGAANGTAVAAAPGGQQGPGQPGATLVAPAEDLNTVGPPTGAGKDPFQPIGIATPPTAAPAGPKPFKTALAVLKSPPPPAPREKLPSSLSDLLNSKGQGPNQPQNAPTAGSVNPVEVAPEAPDLNVTGIVLGDPTTGNPRNVAILRAKSGDERRFVSVGDYVGNGFTVVAVHADGVEIKDKAGNRRVTIKLGQPLGSGTLSTGDRTRAK